MSNSRWLTGCCFFLHKERAAPKRSPFLGFKGLLILSQAELLSARGYESVLQ